MAVDLMIVGAPKSGTTALLAYLGQHPGIQPQLQPEMTWFADDRLHAAPFPDALYFGGDQRDGRLRLGKSAGLMYREKTVSRLRQLNPDVEAIVILREPVARMYSAFWFARQRGRETRDAFEHALDPAGQEEFRELEGSLYSTYVRLLFDHLGRDSVHVIVFEELVEDPRRALEPLLGRLQLDPAGLGAALPRENSGQAARSQRLAQVRRSDRMAQTARRVLPSSLRGRVRRVYRRVNESDARPPAIDPGLEADLRARLEGPNRELEELLGRRIEAWTPISRTPP